MESLAIKNLFKGIYKNKTVLVTGHTGFKGSWLSLWLDRLGAKVVGYSLEAPTSPNHFQYISSNITSIIADIKDSKKLDETINKYKPDIVFHLAAQALVRYSYENPLETYETNVIGTLKVFESCRKYKVKAIVNITSDKAYENKEQTKGYKENDSFGGYDPYSSSKGCTEILTSSYRNSFFNIHDYEEKHNTLLASCRAGNVIGGGDWAKDRLITDIILSISQSKKVIIRNPKATRPWQHVLEPLSGYLLVGQKLLEKEKRFAQGWNFGPPNNSKITVKQVIKNIQQYWSNLEYEIDTKKTHPHEATLLSLDCSKANSLLHWDNIWSTKQTFEKTIKWYKDFYEKQQINTSNDLENFINDAITKETIWTRN